MKKLLPLLTLLLLFQTVKGNGNSKTQCIAQYPSTPGLTQTHPTQAQLSAILNSEDIEFFEFVRATVWVHVKKEDYQHARAVLLERVRSGDLKPEVIYVPEANQKGRDGVYRYDYKLAGEIIRKELMPTSRRSQLAMLAPRL